MQSHLTNCDCDLCRMQCSPITMTADITRMPFVVGRIIVPTVPPPLSVEISPPSTPAK